MGGGGAVVLLVGWLLITIRPSIQLKSSHPLHDVVDRINDGVNDRGGGGGGYIGLVMAYPPEEFALVASGFFVPNSLIPWVDLSGRRFHIGKIKNVNVIYVMTGEQTLNAGITVQILLDVFDIKGIVHYGTAGSTNDSLSIGDVSVPSYVALAGSWSWKESLAEEEGLMELEFGAYNFPAKGENLLGKIDFTTEQVFSNEKPMEDAFWIPVERKWLTLASNQLQDVKLLQCVNETYCLPETPKVVYGLRASSADILLHNAAYRKFLFSNFNISTVDEESSAILMTSITNGVPCIVFRGVSDMAGAGVMPSSTDSSTSLASINALTVAVEFIGLFGSTYPTADH